MRYTDSIELPGWLTLADAESVEDAIRGYGTVEKVGRKLTFTVEANDLWELREQLDEVETDLNSRSLPFTIDKAKVEGRPAFDSLRQALEGLRDHGYQPMYNGRPSCPFCLEFVDEESTHAPGCILVRSLA